MNLVALREKAEHSKFYRWLLSQGLNRMVPFNFPHKFRVEEISTNHLQVVLPYRKRNLNHLKGLHACALATLTEISSGFLLISKLDPKRYRIILEKLEIEYHYQAKMEAYARFEITDEWMEANILEPLKKEPKVSVPCVIKIHDRDGNHLTTGTARWQIKDWKQVKTSL